MPNGHYWTKYKDNPWTVGKYRDGQWTFIGDEESYDMSKLPGPFVVGPHIPEPQ